MTHTEIVTEDLLLRLRAQQHDAFNFLVKNFHNRLVSFAATVAGNTQAEEIVQDAWISIYKALPGFESRSSLKTWLYTIVRNECYKRIKKESRKPDRIRTNGDDADPLDSWFASSFVEDGHWSGELSEWNINTPEALLQEQQLQKCIDHTLKLLKPDQKAVFELRQLQQETMEEVCNILNISHSNARVLLHRARLILMQVINNYQETGEC